MPRYIALLRGIAPMNPNMRNERLREVFEALGFAQVKTIISSGNVVFDSPSTDIPALETTIEEAFPVRLGFQSSVIIRGRKAWQQLLAHNPFKHYTHQAATYLTVTFLKHPPDAQARKQAWPADRSFHLAAVYDREICCVTDTTAAKTPDVMSYLERRYGKEVTTRTWKTVERIAPHFDL